MSLGRCWTWPGRLAGAVIIGAIHIYQRILSPFLGNACRFEPTCSRYMVGAIEKYGVMRGVWKGLGRIGRCHPWHPGGVDPP